MLAEAIYSAVKYGMEGAEAAILRALVDKSLAVVRAGIFGAMTLKLHEAEILLLDLLRRCPKEDDEVLLETIWAIGEAGSEASIEPLVAQARRTDDEMQKSAIATVLGALGSMDTIQYLEQGPIFGYWVSPSEFDPTEGWVLPLPVHRAISEIRSRASSTRIDSART